MTVSDQLARYVAQLIQKHLPLTTQEENWQVSQGSICAAWAEFVECLNPPGRRGRGRSPSDLKVLNNGNLASMFLWILSRKIAIEERDLEGADSVCYLNRIMHGIDVWHHVKPPAYFIFVHTVGTVLGRSRLGDYLVVYQNCSIGGARGGYDIDPKDSRPNFGEGVVMYTGAKVLGASTIGNNCILAANALVIDAEIPDDSVVSGQGSNLRIWKNKTSVVRAFFGN